MGGVRERKGSTMTAKTDFRTDEQRVAAEEVAAELDRAYYAARDKLISVGIDFDLDSTRCTLCGCQGYQGPGIGCTTPGCGHRIFRHLNTT